MGGNKLTYDIAYSFDRCCEIYTLEKLKPLNQREKSQITSCLLIYIFAWLLCPRSLNFSEFRQPNIIANGNIFTMFFFYHIGQKIEGRAGAWAE